MSVSGGGTNQPSTGVPGRWKKRLPAPVWIKPSPLQVTGAMVVGINCVSQMCFSNQHFARRVITTAFLTPLTWDLHRGGDRSGRQDRSVGRRQNLCSPALQSSDKVRTGALNSRGFAHWEGPPLVLAEVLEFPESIQKSELNPCVMFLRDCLKILVTIFRFLASVQ